MSNLSLREAARASGTSRSTLLRRIQSGRLPAERTEGGVYAIDPRELMRICPPRADERSAEEDERGETGREIVPAATLDLHIRLARAEAEIAALQALVATEKAHAEEIRQDRDRWRIQAERLATRQADQAPDLGEVPRAVERGLKFLRWAKSEAGM